MTSVGIFCIAIIKSFRPLLLLEASWERFESVGEVWLAGTFRPGSLLPVPRVKCRPPPRTKPLSPLFPLPPSPPPFGTPPYPSNGKTSLAICV